MVFRVAAVRSARKAAYWKIEARGTILALIVPVGREVHSLIRLAGVLENVRNSPIDLGVTPAATLIGKRPGISQTAEHESVPDGRNPCLIAAEPCNRTNRSRNEQEAVRESMWNCTELPSKKCGHRHPGEIVVAKGWMARMAREEHFTRRLAR